ncbi:MAG: phosphatase [Butyricicoccus sp.]|nr:phosphatase [Butyricicoccus sp.]
MKIIADLHTHTNVSHHAYSSLEEMVQGAKRAGHRAIAITNHGPAVEDGAHPWHFANLNIVPRKIDGIVVLRGIELNILPPNGGIDPIELRTLKRLDYVIASFHSPAFPPADPEVHTLALENILRNPYVTTLGHMGSEQFAFDQERIISQCNEFGKIVEINNNSLAIRRGSRKNCASIAKLCMKYRVPIVVTSDSHISYMVGAVSEAVQMLEEIGFPEELILNTDWDRLAAYFQKIRGLDINSFQEGEV